MRSGARTWTLSLEGEHADVRIAIDARELIGRVTGVGRYLSEILSAWCELPAATRHELILCAPAPIDVSRWPALHMRTLGAPMPVAVGQGSTWGPPSGGPGGTLWEQTTLPRLLRRANVDLLWAPAYTGPIWSPVPMVLTIHDVSFAAHPEWFSWREGMRRRLLTRLSGQRARRVLTDSSFSKEEIRRHLHVDGDAIDVIYPGVRPVSSTPSSPPASAPTALFVGSIFNRRHVPELIDAFGRLAERRPDVHLEIVGDNRTHPPVDIHALASRNGSRVRVRSYVSDAELTSLYGSASAFVFLSDYEGFGFTPLEALSAGVPIVVLDTPVAREIYGPAAVYVDAPDPSLIEAALELVLFDTERRARLMDAAATILPRYSWQECAHRTLQVLLGATK